MGGAVGHLSWLAYGVWGFVGVFCVEGMEYSGVVQRTGRAPWRVEGQDPTAYLIALAIRFTIAVALAVAAGQSHQVSNPFGAIAVGASAPLIVEQMARRIPRGVDQDANEPADGTQATANAKAKANTDALS